MQAVKRWMMTLVMSVYMLAAGSAWAEIVTYTERVTFEAAVKAVTTVSFNGLALVGGYSEVPSAATFGGVIFRENMYAVNDAPWDQGFAAGTEVLVLTAAGQTATPPEGQTVFGVDVYRLVQNVKPDKSGGWKYGASQYATVTVNYSDSQTTVFNLDWGLTEPGALQSTAKFVGVTSSDPNVTITSVIFNSEVAENGLKAPVIDNFTYGVFNQENLTIYTDRVAFWAATQAARTETFSNLAPSGLYSLMPAASTFGGVTVNEMTYALNGADWGQGFVSGSSVLCLHNDGTTAILPSGQTVFGVDVYRLVQNVNPDKSGGWKYGESRYASVTVTYSDDRTSKVTLDWGVAEPDSKQSVIKFVGVISSDPGLTITSVTFNRYNPATGYMTPTIDNLTYGAFNDNSLTKYNNRAVFEAAIKASTTIPFSGLAQVGSYAAISTDSVIEGVTFTRGPGAGDYIMYPLNGPGWGQGFVAGLEVLCLNKITQTATPPGIQTACGVDIYRLVEPEGGGYGLSQYVAATVNFSNGKVATFVLDWGLTEPNALQSVAKFVGVTSSDPEVTVTSVVFHGSDSDNGLKAAVIDNFTYGRVPSLGGTLMTVQ